MNTDPNVETPNLEGATGNQPAVSQSQGSSIDGKSPSSQELLELRKEIALTQKELKGLQSRQDKDKSETQRFMEEIKAYTSKGKSLEEAEQAVYADREVKQKDDLLIRIAQKVGVLETSPQNVTGNNNNAVDEVTAVFNRLGVDPNHPEASSLYGLKGLDLYDGVAKLAIKSKSTSTPDSSEATSLQGSPAPQAGVKELTTKYQQDILATPRGKSGDSLRRQLKEQARKNGVPVDSIAFV